MYPLREVKKKCLDVQEGKTAMGVVRDNSF